MSRLQSPRRVNCCCRSITTTATTTTTSAVAHANATGYSPHASARVPTPSKRGPLPIFEDE